MGALALVLALSLQAPSPTPAESRDGACALPETLRRALSDRFGSARVLQSSDLYDDERALFKAEHPGGCPGVATGKFFGASERPAYAVVLRDVEPKKNLRLVVARPALTSWVLFEVDELDAGSTVVVGRARTAVETGNEPLPERDTRREAVTLTSYETWRRIYTWTGRAFEKRAPSQ